MRDVDYFWYWRPERDFPPQPVTRPEEVRESERLNIACTQTGFPARQQQEIVTAWARLLPTLTNLRYLWMTSRVPQLLFEAACQVPCLEGLYIKWSGITDLKPITTAAGIRRFHLGPSARVKSIAPLGELRQLSWLGLELLSRIRHLDPISQLVGLEGLSLEGSMGTTWRVTTLAPLGTLKSLRYLSIANLRSDDRSLTPLFPLTRLAQFRHATWWSQSELDQIRCRNPGLAA